MNAQVVLNELQSGNVNTIYDEDGETPDLIELYNSGSVAINLQGWSLTEDSLEKFKWVFPDYSLEPGKFLLVFASGKDRLTGNLHTNFKVSSGNEGVYLYRNDGTRIDVLFPGCIPSNLSYGRQPDGSSSLFHFNEPSPGTSNNTSSTQVISVIQDTVIFSHAPGYYLDSFLLELKTLNANTIIYYTLDGSVPDNTSLKYIAPILIYNRTEEKNKLSEIPTTHKINEPADNIFKGNIITAIAYDESCPASEAFINSYFVDKNIYTRYKFPVISLTTERKNFFGDTYGIYVPGDSGSTENYLEQGEEWERPVHIEYFTPNGMQVFEMDLGARIHGRSSRHDFQKSLRLYAKDKYGADTIAYRFFADKNIDTFKRVILRSAMSSKTLFRDELAHTLVKDMNMDYQEALPVILFINGEYWGIHNLRERQDKYYLQSNHEVNPENIDILGHAFEIDEEIEGDAQHYNALIDFINMNSLSDSSNYQYIRSKIDIENFIDINIAELFLANHDWPRNNVRYWRERTDSSKYRWLFFDCDYCFEVADYDHFRFLIVGEPTYEKGTFLLRNLFKNEEFKTQFIQRFLYLLNTTFEPQNIISQIDSFERSYAPMVHEHIERWNRPDSYTAWHSSVQELKSFSIVRPYEMLSQLQSIFKNPFTVYPNPSAGNLNVRMGDVPADIDLSLRIFNIYGQQVYNVDFNAGTVNGNVPLDISGFQSGLYLFQIRYGKVIYNEKIVISH